MSIKNIVALFFGVAYILACLIIYNAYSMENEGWLIMFFLAFPFSFVSMVVSHYTGGLLLFVIMNATWWFFLIKLFFYLYEKFLNSNSISTDQ